MIPEETDTIFSLHADHIEYGVSGRTLVPGRPFCALTYRLKGSISLTCGGKTLISKPGQITYMPQKMTYLTSVLEAGDMIAVHYTSSRIDPSLSVYTPKDSARFRALFLLLQRHASAHRMLEAQSTFYSILALLRQEQTAVLPQWMTEACEEIRRRLDDPTLTVSELVASAHVSESYFRREFNHYFGQSPNRYIRSCRLERAALLLETGLCSVTEAASQCGFDSLSYFSSEFRKAYGTVPSQCAEIKRTKE